MRSRGRVRMRGPEAVEGGGMNLCCYAGQGCVSWDATPGVGESQEREGSTQLLLLLLLLLLRLLSKLRQVRPPHPHSIPQIRVIG